MVATLVVIAVVRDWTPILRPDAVPPAPFAGAAIGLVAGLHPAWRAVRAKPVDAIRRRRSPTPAEDRDTHAALALPGPDTVLFSHPN